MQTVEIWSVTIHSRSDGAPSWSRRFVGRPTRCDLQEALASEHADKQCPHQQCVEVFVDLANRLEMNYAIAATRGAYVISSAHVQIGSVALRKEAAYAPGSTR